MQHEDGKGDFRIEHMRNVYQWLSDIVLILLFLKNKLFMCT